MISSLLRRHCLMISNVICSFVLALNKLIFVPVKARKCGSGWSILEDLHDVMGTCVHLVSQHSK